MSKLDRDLFNVDPFRYWDEETKSYDLLIDKSKVEVLLWGSRAEPQARILSKSRLEFDPIKLKKYEAYLVANGYTRDAVIGHLRTLNAPLTAKLNARRGRFTYTEGKVEVGEALPTPVSVVLSGSSSATILFNGQAASSYFPEASSLRYTYSISGQSGIRGVLGNQHGVVTVKDGQVVASGTPNGVSFASGISAVGLQIKQPGDFGLEQGPKPSDADIKAVGSRFTGLIFYVESFKMTVDGSLEDFFFFLVKKNPKATALAARLAYASDTNAYPSFYFVASEKWAASTLAYLEREVYPNVKSASQLSMVNALVNSWFEPGEAASSSGSAEAGDGSYFVYGHQASFQTLKVEFSQLDDVKLGSWSVRRGVEEIVWAKFKPVDLRPIVVAQLSSKKLSKNERSELEGALKDMDKAPDTVIGVVRYARAQRLPIDPLSRIDVASFGLPGGVSIDDEVMFEDESTRLTWKQASRRVDKMVSSDFFFAVDNKSEGVEQTSLTVGDAKTHVVLAERLVSGAIEFFIATKANTLPVSEAIDADEALIHLQEGYALVKGGTFRGVEQWAALLAAELDVPSLDSIIQRDAEGKAFSMSNVDIKRYDIRRYYSNGFLAWHLLSDEDRDYVALLAKGSEYGTNVRDSFNALMRANLGLYCLDVGIAY